MKAAGLLQNQFPGSGLDPVLQDPAMAAYAVRVNQESQYRLYHTAFTTALSSSPNARPGTQAPTDWIAVAVRGAAADKYYDLVGTTEDPYDENKL